ncbi:Endoglucanase precursor [compost metagenome]
MAYSNESYWNNQREKLGIYEYDQAKGCFVYVGGITDFEGQEGRYVRTSITGSGIYAVLLRNITFADVPSNHWASSKIEVLASRGIVDGMSANTFAPKGTLTRAQFSKMLAGALGISPLHPDRPTFSDVGQQKWSYGWIEAAAAAGIVQGDNGKFKPDDALTREQMMTMLVRAAESRLSAADQGKSNVSLDQFTDSSTISSWAKPYVTKALTLQLIEGSGDKLNARSQTTRAEAAAVIYRLMDQLNLL